MAIGVVGAGVIGTGVAENLAFTGHEVVLIDVSAEQLEKAISRIRDSLRAARMLGQSLGGESTAAILARVKPTTSYKALADVGLVIENVVERWEVKKNVYAELETTCAPACIFLANTSSIPIRHIAESTRRADRVIGVHFMNPVPRKSTVELICGPATSQDTRARTERLLAEMGKQAIIVQDCPGFVSNRVLMLTINEAILVVEQAIATAGDVDRLFRECFGHAMGPLETADLIGLDTVLDTLLSLREFTGNDKFEPSLLLRQMVCKGVTGRKSGQGFFRYV
jgi:3-hydroxybutyryl-CoA dehydrogenase